MNKEKFEQIQLLGSVHTVSVQTKQRAEARTTEVDMCTTIRPPAHEEGYYTIKLNPNRYCGQNIDVGDAATLFWTVKEMLMYCGVTKYRYVRVDFRLDAYDEEHFKNYRKLYHLLVIMMADAFELRNNYRTLDAFNPDVVKSIATKPMKSQGKNIEMEAYDKQRESEGRDKATSRLELRTTYLRCGVKDEFCKLWCQRLDISLKSYKTVQEIINENLIHIYQNFPPTKYTVFLLMYQDWIFTRWQMTDLLLKMGYAEEEAKMKAAYFKKKYKTEFISSTEVKQVHAKIKREIKRFFRRTKISEPLYDEMEDWEKGEVELY